MCASEPAQRGKKRSKIDVDVLIILSKGMDFLASMSFCCFAYTLVTPVLLGVVIINLYSLAHLQAQMNCVSFYLQNNAV